MLEDAASQNSISSLFSAVLVPHLLLVAQQVIATLACKQQHGSSTQPTGPQESGQQGAQASVSPRAPPTRLGTGS
jgi:TRAP-type C4-dicarboxylate transport system permease large subunit